MKQAYLSELAGKPLVGYLAKAGYNINFIRQNNYVDPRISTHADLFMCQFGLWDEAALFFGDPEKLGSDYPKDIIYNAVCTRDYFVHSINYTDPFMMQSMMMWHESMSYEDGISELGRVADVRQGYSR